MPYQWLGRLIRRRPVRLEPTFAPPAQYPDTVHADATELQALRQAESEGQAYLARLAQIHRMGEMPGTRSASPGEHEPKN